MSLLLVSKVLVCFKHQSSDIPHTEQNSIDNEKKNELQPIPVFKSGKDLLLLYTP